MTTSTSRKVNLDDMLPLLRSIQNEISERMLKVEALEQRIDTLAPLRTGRSTAVPSELALIEAELSSQRRELRLIAKELARLGVSFDADHPHPIVLPARSDGMTRLAETGFQPWMADSRS